MRQIVLLSLGCVLVCFAWPAVSTPSDNGAIDYTPQLPVVAGEEAEGYGGTGRMLVREPLTTLWDVLVDFARYPRIFPAVQASRILTADATGAVVRFEVDVGWLTARYAVRYTIDASARTLQWQLVPHAANTLTSNAGYVRLEAVSPELTRVIYSVAGDLKGARLIPAFLKRVLAKRSILQAMHAFRCYIEGNGHGDREMSGEDSYVAVRTCRGA